MLSIPVAPHSTQDLAKKTVAAIGLAIGFRARGRAVEDNLERHKVRCPDNERALGCNFTE